MSHSDTDTNSPLGKESADTGSPSDGNDVHDETHNTSQKSYMLLDEEIRRIYFRFYSESYKCQSGGFDRKTKEFIAIAAALLAGCQNCLEGHIKKAVEYGATQKELAETLAIAIGVAGANVVDRSDRAVANLGLNEFLTGTNQDKD